MTEQLILVDSDDQEVGTSEKLRAHELGLLHRCFSIFVFNSAGELLLQRRALSKYHSPGLWSNTCCGHPRPGEETLDAAHRRLMEEFGFDCDLEEKFSFSYRTEFENGLKENEFDHVFFGVFDGKPAPDHLEVGDFRFVRLAQLKEELRQDPDSFTFWLKICLAKVAELWPRGGDESFTK